MPTITLTQPAIDKIKPPAKGRVEYWDKVLPGLGLRVSDSGRKTWVVLYRVNGKLVRETLGTTALLPSVAEARDRARASLQTAQKGINPVAEKRQAAQAVEVQAKADAVRQRDTLAAILDRYLAEYGAKRWRPETFAEVRRSLETDVKPVLGGRPIADITRRDVRELLDGIVARDRAPHAHHVLAYLRPALAWAAEREIITSNPADGVPDPDPRKREARTRERYLDDDEIALFWRSAADLGWPFGPLFQLLLLTAQRRDELAHAVWAEFDLAGRVWTLPRELCKNGKAHVVHLAPPAIEIIEALPRRADTGLMFSTNGARPVSGFGHASQRLAAAMLKRRKTELLEAGKAREAADAAMEHFTIHDLRRTAATGMARIGIAHHVLDRVLNHTSGKISGVGAIYNRFEYLAERQAASEAWSRHVESLVRPVPSNVVPLSAGARHG
jgi:integrase